MEQFKHTDGRTFSRKGTTEHTTRDGRNVVLIVWETSCAHEGCDQRVTVKTVTEDPTTWSRFTPPRFCEPHRNLARKEANKRRIKARADGLARWRESDEGKKALAERSENYMGKNEQMVYDTIKEIADLLGPAEPPADMGEHTRQMFTARHGRRNTVPTTEVWRVVVARMASPVEGKRDTRVARYAKARDSLVSKGYITYYGGHFSILR